MFRLPKSLKNLRRYCTETKRKFVQVCVLGADTITGQILSLLLKQSPTISTLHLHGISRIESIGLDVDYIDTRCVVNTHNGVESRCNAVKGADIIVMLGMQPLSCKTSLAKHVMIEGPRVVQLAETCSKYAPKAIVIVAVNPVSVMLPMVSEVYRQNVWYHPGKIIGSTAFAQTKANSIAGHFQTLDPKIVHVPLVGGPDLDCCVPLFTKCNPAGLSAKNAKQLYEKFRSNTGDESYSTAFGLNRMITGVAMGINEHPLANVCAFVRSNIVPTFKYLTALVRIGPAGIIHNYGLQKLSKPELFQFEEVCLELKNREKIAHDFVYIKDDCTVPEFMVKEMEEERQMQMTVIR